jgi:hypothetical protein
MTTTMISRMISAMTPAMMPAMAAADIPESLESAALGSTPRSDIGAADDERLADGVTAAVVDLLSVRDTVGVLDSLGSADGAGALEGDGSALAATGADEGDSGTVDGDAEAGMNDGEREGVTAVPAAHFPAVHTPLLQSRASRHFCVDEHCLHAVPPQSMSVSTPFLMPSVQEYAGFTAHSCGWGREAPAARTHGSFRMEVACDGAKAAAATARSQDITGCPHHTVHHSAVAILWV